VRIRPPQVIISVLLTRGHPWTVTIPQYRVNKTKQHTRLVNVIVVGPFEEEEEGTGVASDVAKVQGEDLDTPGHLRGDRVRLGRQGSRIVCASQLARS